MWCMYALSEAMHACSDRVAFVADMLFVVTVEPLLALISYMGPLIQPRH